MSESNEPLPVGTILDGKWKIDRPLGEGGMGVVYAAAHARNGLSVAIKVLHPKLARDKAVKERFLYEGYAANRVGHPGTVQVLDDGQTSDGFVYLVMERLVGEAVADRADRLGGALPLPEVIAIADAALDILAAAHKAGIVHRDFKPENLFLTREGVLKVLDFGLARVKETTNKARLTVAGVLMGTPAFMPPEQAQANWDEVDARSDVYSVGASLFSLATGRLVHDGATPLQILVKVSTERAPPLLSAVPSAPPAIATVVDRALEKPRDARWPDAAAMLEALRGAMFRSSFSAASLRAMAAAAPTATPGETSASAGPRSTEAGAPLAYDDAANNNPGAFTKEPATPRMSKDAAPPIAERQRAVIVAPGALRANAEATGPQAYAPTALPNMLPSFDAPRSTTDPLPPGAGLATSKAEPKNPAVRTVAPTSSDAPTTRRRRPTSSGKLALAVSGVVLAVVVVAFVFALVAFRNVFRRKAVAAEPTATTESSSPIEPVPTTEKRALPTSHATASAIASSTASAHHPVPSASASKKK